MNENDNSGFEAFETAMLGEDNQFGDEAAEQAQEPSEPSQDNGSQEEREEGAEEAENGSPEETQPPEETPPPAETFTLRVNKEDRQVSREEMISLAQKGADYDRVKEQNLTQQQTIQELKEKLSIYQISPEAMETLSIISQRTNTDLEQLAESLYISLRRGEGAVEETARQELKSARLEKRLDAMQNQKAQRQAQEEDQQAQERARRELEEFRREYPGVNLTGDLVEKLMAPVQDGMSLTEAYRKYENAQQAAEIAALKRQLAAKKQNDENLRHSPGSQRDGGGKHTKEPFDDFLKAFA